MSTFLCSQLDLNLLQVFIKALDFFLVFLFELLKMLFALLQFNILHLVSLLKFLVLDFEICWLLGQLLNHIFHFFTVLSIMLLGALILRLVLLNVVSHHFILLHKLFVYLEQSY